MKDEEYYRDRTDEQGCDIEGASDELMPQKGKRRSWSFAALVLSILSLTISVFSPISIALGVTSFVLCVVSRIKLGYFDRLSILALILGIFGASVGLFFYLVFLFPTLGDAIKGLVF